MSIMAHVSARSILSRSRLPWVLPWCIRGLIRHRVAKIERWFRGVRDQFLPLHQDAATIQQQLNERLESWLDEYHQQPHGTTKELPFERYRKNLSCVRPAPPQLLDYFRLIEFCKVKRSHGGTVWKLYEVPVQLIDRRVELHYHDHDRERVENLFENRSFGLAVLSDAAVNSRIGRNWNSGDSKETVEPAPQAALAVTLPVSGMLFKGEAIYEPIP